MKKIITIFFILFTSQVVKASSNNIIKFNLKKDNWAEKSVFLIKNLENNETHQVEVDFLKELVLPLSIKRIEVKEIACDYHYECNPETYDFDFSNNSIYEINYTYKIKEVTVNYKAYYQNKIKNELQEEYQTTLNIYDENLNLIKLVDSVSFQIPIGNYIIKDNKYEKYYKLSFEEEKNEIIITQNLIDQLVVNKKVNAICNEEKCFDFTQYKSIINFTNPIIPGKYMINDQEFFLTENLPSLNYEDYNVVIINIDNGDDFLLDIPNTELSFLKENYLYVEKKFYCYKSYNYNCFFN